MYGYVPKYMYLIVSIVMIIYKWYTYHAILTEHDHMITNEIPLIRYAVRCKYISTIDNAK